jgi:hypothetical protein
LKIFEINQKELVIGYLDIIDINEPIEEYVVQIEMTCGVYDLKSSI